MDVFEVESSVRGHHVYMQEWTPFIGEKLECQREETNEQDPYAVAIVKRTAGRRTNSWARVGPFSAVYLPIIALSLAV